MYNKEKISKEVGFFSNVRVIIPSEKYVDRIIKDVLDGDELSARYLLRIIRFTVPKNKIENKNYNRLVYVYNKIFC